MKLLKLIICFCVFVLVSTVVFAEIYVNNFYSELETGFQEQEDSIVDTLDKFYRFYKNTTYCRYVTGFNSDISFKFENGIKRYNDNQLDNRFHIATFSYLSKQSAIFDFIFDLKYGEIINETLKENSYMIYGFEPKLVADINTYQISGSMGYFIKEFDRSEIQSNNYGELTNYYLAKGNVMTDLSFNLGFIKQFTETTSFKAGYSLKLIENEIDRVIDSKTAHNAKIGFYWKR
jgi:hypothetical protein